MKTSLDPRHKKRQETIKVLYAESFHTQPTDNLTAKAILSSLKKVDRMLFKVAPGFPIEKINKVDLAILRL